MSNQTHETRIAVDEAAAANAQLIQEYYAAWSRQDVDGVVAFFEETSVFDERAFEAGFKGLEEIRGFVEMTYAGSPDFTVIPQRITGSGDDLAVEWQMSGTHTGDMPGLPATGKTYKLLAVSFIRMEAGKIAHMCDYWNPNEFARQVGLI